MRALPAYKNTERQELLEQYLHRWLTSHALNLSDLARPEVRQALLQTLSGDLGTILGRRADVLAGMLGIKVMQIGSDLLKRGAEKLLGAKR